jgi:hypothetical protein
MYKAINQKSNEEIVILDPSWDRENISVLRGWDQKDLLVCQECQQPVRVRAGQVRIWHFAHKHLNNCPAGNESPQLLQARVILYRWLVSKYGSERVTLEKKLPETGLPRPVDCWVAGKEASGPIAYWIFDAGLQPKSRQAIQSALASPSISTNWLFLAAMLRPDKEDGAAIHLTTTEREFMSHSEYSQLARRHTFEAVGDTLHYLDHETSLLTTYRGLRLVHSPQVYQGSIVSHPIEEVLVSPKSGEFVHPGEYEQLQAYKKKEAEESEKRKAREQQKLEKLRQAKSKETKPEQVAVREHQSPPVSDSFLQQQSAPNAAPPPPPQVQKAICEFCGEYTDDWWFFDGEKQTCRCRSCLQRGMSRSA